MLVSLTSGLSQGDVGTAGLEFHDAADVAGAQHGNLLLLGTCNRIDCGKALAVAVFRVGKVGTFLEHAAHYLEVSDIAEVLLDTGLEDEDAGGSRFLAGDLLAGDGLVDCSLGAVGSLDAEFHKLLDTHVLLCGEAEDRHDLALGDTELESLCELLLAEGKLVEVLHHEFVVGLGSLLHEGHAHFLGLVGILCGNLEFFALAVGIEEVIVLHVDNVDEALEAGTGIDGELHECSLAAESGLDAVVGLVPIRLLVVELVDCENEGNVVFGCLTGKYLCAHLDALRAVDEQDTCLADLEGLHCTSDEIVGTGSVDDVELGVHEFGIEGRSEDGLLVGLFELGVVGDCVLVFNGTTAVDDLAFEEHCLGERGLSGL